MKNLIQKALLVPLFLAMSLTACGTNSAPAKGYAKYKEKIANYYKSIGGTGKEISYNSCRYVWITGDGTMEAGNLKDTVWYTISYTATIGGSSLTKNTCVEYSVSSDYVQELSSGTAYSYAYDLVKNGSLKGTTGSL